MSRGWRWSRGQSLEPELTVELGLSLMKDSRSTQYPSSREVLFWAAFMVKLNCRGHPVGVRVLALATAFTVSKTMFQFPVERSGWFSGWV